MKFRFALVLCVVLLYCTISHATITVCNEYSTKVDQSCSQQSDCPDADGNDAGAGNCETVAGNTISICNYFSSNRGKVCSQQSDCPDYSGTDGGVGDCGVYVRSTSVYGLPMYGYLHPGTGSSSWIVQDREFKESVDAQLDVLSSSISSATLQQTHDASGSSPSMTLSTNGLTFFGVNDQASAVRACATGDTSDCLEIYDDPTDGWTIGTTLANNQTFNVANNQALIIQTDGTEFERIDEATRVRQYAAANPPYHPILWTAGGVEVDGTNCQKSTAAVNSSESLKAMICQDGGKFVGQFKLPLAYRDGTDLTFYMELVTVGTSSVTSAFDVSAWCRGVGDTVNSTYGTPGNCDITTGTSASVIRSCNVTITPNGSCVAGDTVSWRAVVDDTNSGLTQSNGRILHGTINWVRQKDREN